MVGKLDNSISQPVVALSNTLWPCPLKEESFPGPCWLKQVWGLESLIRECCLKYSGKEFKKKKRW